MTRLVTGLIVTTCLVVIVICLHFIIKDRSEYFNQVKTECESKICNIGKPMVVWGRRSSVCICAEVPR